QCPPRFVRAPRKTVQHAAQAAMLRRFERVQDLRMRFAIVDHDRQVELLGETKLSGERSALRIEGRPVAIKIEPDLADPRNLRVLGPRTNAALGIFSPLQRFMRMNANRRANDLEALGNLDGPRRFLESDSGYENAGDAGLFRAPHDLFEIRRKCVGIEMAMRVDHEMLILRPIANTKRREHR